MFGAIGNVIVTIDLTTGDATPLGTTHDFADVRAMPMIPQPIPYMGQLIPSRIQSS